MNNNRGNNRRRGRGNRPQGGGQQLNRIDSRARGNAPQLLEKYRKLAQDAHLNGDRVQAEYYLQFADHYFRVIADTRLRQEESRGRPQGERWQEGGEDGEDGAEFSADNDFPSFDQPNYNRRERDDRPRDDRQREERPRDDRQREDRPREDRPRQPRQPREDRFSDSEELQVEVEANGDGEIGVEAAANPYEPPENPFVRESRGPRAGLRPRREDRRPRREEPADDEPAGLDPSSLPPAISAPREEPAAEEPAVEAKPRRGRPRKPRPDDAGEALESVN